jgi:MoxR-like ATPase
MSDAPETLSNEDVVEAAPAAPDALSQDDLAAVDHMKQSHETIRKELAKVIVGMDPVIEELLISIFSRGHCILEGVPGLAKTLLISTLARSLSLSFSRIQFTPDLMPSDITGTEVIQEDKATGHREFKFLPGPIFANIILADEINRTPPKTQAALLEAMQERQVTIGGDRHPLDPPFFVLATQNPIEQEGTYPLPEAQQDRFMFKIFVNYPNWDEEFDIVNNMTAIEEAEVAQVLTGDDILALQRIVRRVPVAPHVVHYAMRLVRKTRVHEPEGIPQFVKDYVSWGAGPRACQFLVLGARAYAVLQGRYYASVEDIQRVACPVLRHRVITNFNADSEGITPDKIVQELISTTPANEEAVSNDAKLQGTFKE